MKNVRIPLVALACILVLNLLFVPGFYSITLQNGHLYGSLIDVLNRSVPVALAGIGMSVVISTAGIDLSVGSIAAISGAILATQSGSPVAVVVEAIVAAVCCGLLNGWLIAKWNVQPIVATLILMTAGRGVAQLIANGQVVPIRIAELKQIGGGFMLGFPTPIWIGIFFTVASLTLLKMTALGLFLRAIGASEKASAIAGISIQNFKCAVYGISGFCAGLSGIILASDIGAADANNAAQFLELDAILAACIGGNILTGGRLTIIGTVIGAVLLQALTTTLLTYGFSQEITLILKALLIVSLGLLGRVRSKKSLVPVQG